jgi:hypothetical protein
MVLYFTTHHANKICNHDMMEWSQLPTNHTILFLVMCCCVLRCVVSFMAFWHNLTTRRSYWELYKLIEVRAVLIYGWVSWSFNRQGPSLDGHGLSIDEPYLQMGCNITFGYWVLYTFENTLILHFHGIHGSTYPTTIAQKQETTILDVAQIELVSIVVNSKHNIRWICDVKFLSFRFLLSSTELNYSMQ